MFKKKMIVRFDGSYTFSDVNPGLSKEGKGVSHMFSPYNANNSKTKYLFFAWVHQMDSIHVYTAGKKMLVY